MHCYCFNWGCWSCRHRYKDGTIFMYMINMAICMFLCRLWAFINNLQCWLTITWVGFLNDPIMGSYTRIQQILGYHFGWVVSTLASQQDPGFDFRVRTRPSCVEFACWGWFENLDWGLSMRVNVARVCKYIGRWTDGWLYTQSSWISPICICVHVGEGPDRPCRLLSCLSVNEFRVSPHVTGCNPLDKTCTAFWLRHSVCNSYEQVRRERERQMAAEQ